MRRKARNPYRIPLLLLAMAVVLRPVVVEANSLLNPPTVSPSLHHPFHLIVHSKAVCPTRLRKNLEHPLGGLKFLPKESVGAFHFSPGFAKLVLLPESSRLRAAVNAFHSRTSRQFLILRI